MPGLLQSSKGVVKFVFLTAPSGGLLGKGFGSMVPNMLFHIQLHTWAFLEVLCTSDAPGKLWCVTLCFHGTCVVNPAH